MNQALKLSIVFGASVTALSCPNSSKYSTTSNRDILMFNNEINCKGQVDSRWYPNGEWCQVRITPTDKFCLQVGDATCHFSVDYIDNTPPNPQYKNIDDQACDNLAYCGSTDCPNRGNNAGFEEEEEGLQTGGLVGLIIGALFLISVVWCLARCCGCCRMKSVNKEEKAPERRDEEQVEMPKQTYHLQEVYPAPQNMMQPGQYPPPQQM